MGPCRCSDTPTAVLRHSDRPFSPQLQALGRLLVLAQPDTLRRLVLAGGLEEPEDLDQEVGAPVTGKWVPWATCPFR